MSGEHSIWETDRWLDWLRRKTSRSAQGASKAAATRASPEVKTAQPAREPLLREQVATVGAEVPTATPASDTELLRRLGWKHVGTSWQGWFRFKQAPPIRGRIERSNERSKVYFHRPPGAVQKHVCTHRRSDGWWWLHERSTPPKESVSSTIYRAQTWLHGLLVERRRA